MWAKFHALSWPPFCWHPLEFFSHLAKVPTHLPGRSGMCLSNVVPRCLYITLANWKHFVLYSLATVISDCAEPQVLKWDRITLLKTGWSFRTTLVSESGFCLCGHTLVFAVYSEQFFSRVLPEIYQATLGDVGVVWGSFRSTYWSTCKRPLLKDV